MIRYSVKSDYNSIISLWKEAFGDSEKDIIFFLNKRYKPENTLVVDADGKIASMLFLLEGEMSIKGKSYPSYYLYAACTLNEFRGRGYMASLLDFAKRTAEQREIDYICLMPAEKSLYKFYEKHGYKTVFKRKILTLSSNSININQTVESERIDNIEKIRNHAFHGIDMFKWDNEALKFAFEHNNLYGGQALTHCKGYSLYNIIGSEIVVKECAFTEDLSLELSYIFSKNKNANKIIVHVPADAKTESASFEIIDSGMMLAVNKNAENAMKELHNAYLGLTLD